MTSNNVQKHYQRLHAPRENRAVVVHPDWSRVSDLVLENASLQSQPDFDVHGRKLSDIRLQARKELLEAARHWTSAYRDISAKQNDPSDLIFLAGHQPQMFHPGVWFKNFALGRLAQQHHATAINLIIDSDAVSTTSLRVPGGSAENPSAQQIQFDRPDPAIPFEERRIEDRALFDSFGLRVVDQIAQLIPHPLMESFWPIVLQQSQTTDRLGACIAQARHIIEGRWGLTTLEIPQSWVCDLSSFQWFVAYLLSDMPSFSAVYNEAVREYRRLYRIRSASHPVPDLIADDDWLEAPFWIWSKENPRRKRLFVKHVDNELRITDRQDINERLHLTNQNEVGRAVQQLAELSRRGIKIRSRALVTTLWARLVLGDLFIHGIGGGNYDLVTDRIIERYFHRQAPGFMILSATLHLPIDKSPLNLREGQGEGSIIDRQLRDLTYHPERFLNSLFNQSKGMPGEVQTLVDAKRKWIETPQTIENAKKRCRAIRQINESLQPWLEQRRKELLDHRNQAVEHLHANQIIAWREYAFCLYPEETLRDFLDNQLPQR